MEIAILKAFIDHNKDGFIVRRWFGGSESVLEFSRLTLRNVDVFIGVLKNTANKIEYTLELNVSNKAKAFGVNC